MVLATRVPGHDFGSVYVSMSSWNTKRWWWELGTYKRMSALWFRRFGHIFFPTSGPEVNELPRVVLCFSHKIETDVISLPLYYPWISEPLSSWIPFPFEPMKEQSLFSPRYFISGVARNYMSHLMAQNSCKLRRRMDVPNYARSAQYDLLAWAREGKVECSFAARTRAPPFVFIFSVASSRSLGKQFRLSLRLLDL